MTHKHATGPTSRKAWWPLVQAVASILTADAWSPRPHVYELVGGHGEVHKSLYPKNGSVEVLIGDAGAKLLAQDMNTTWIVEYYDVDCPHCWYFSAIFPELAKSIKSPSVRLGAFNCVDDVNMNACRNASVFAYPTVMVYNARVPGDNHSVHVYDDKADDPKPAKEIAAWLSSFSHGRIKVLHPEVFGVGANSNNTSHAVDPSGPPGKLGWTHEQYGTVQTRFHDAHLGMASLLTGGYVDKEKYQAALNVVQFVARAFGTDESTIFGDLMNKLTVKRDLEPAEFNKIIADWATQFDTHLVFCKTQTCAVWQLFHGIAALIAISYSPIPVAEALPKFRYMVAEFLDCEVCRQHFMASYDDCLFGRCEVLAADGQAAQARALMLWLWRVHNAVSVRVVAEHPPQGPAVDRRWPAYKDCPGCWNSSVVAGQPGKLLTFAGQTNHDQPAYGVFNEDKVVGFMVMTYLGEENATLQVKDQLWKMPRLRLRQTWAYSPHTGIVALPCALAGLIVLFLAVSSRKKLLCPAEEGAVGTMYDGMTPLPSAKLVE